MALKVELDNDEQEGLKVDIPLFATVEDVLKDVQLEDEQVHITIKSQEE